MTKQTLTIQHIPSVIWGKTADRVFIYVHGKCQNKYEAASFAARAEQSGYQTLSFDLPEHGDRENQATPCDIWHGIEDLQTIYAYAAKRWRRASLFGCSLGAFFALHAYKDIAFETCLFQSPIIDMEYLIRQLFVWFGTSEQELKEKGRIVTPIDTLSWPYYCYVRETPLSERKTPTHILFGGKADMQTEDIMRAFVQTWGGTLTVSPQSEHASLSEDDKEIVCRWLDCHIK